MHADRFVIFPSHISTDLLSFQARSMCCLPFTYACIRMMFPAVICCRQQVCHTARNVDLGDAIVFGLDLLVQMYTITIKYCHFVMSRPMSTSQLG